MRTCCPSCGCVLDVQGHFEINAIADSVPAQPDTVDRLEADVAVVVRRMKGFFLLEQVLWRLAERGYVEQSVLFDTRVRRALSFCARPVRYANGRTVRPSIEGERYDVYTKEPHVLRRDESSAFIRKAVGVNGMEWLHEKAHGTT